MRPSGESDVMIKTVCVCVCVYIRIADENSLIPLEVVDKRNDFSKNKHKKMGGGEDHPFVDLK